MKLTIEKIKEYRQRSTMFLLPLLELPKHIKPLQTYMHIKGFDMNDNCNLIMLFSNKEPNYDQILKRLKASFYYDTHVTQGNFDIIIFDMSSFKEDYKHIFNGKYSKLSKDTKVLINKHGSSEDLSMVAIHPEYYYQEFAMLLNLKPEDILKDQELLSPPDIEKEMIIVSEETQKELRSLYPVI